MTNKHKCVQALRGERGQALAETALFSVLAVILAFGVLTTISIHRTRTAAVTAAYACTQFISQSPNPSWAAYQASTVASKTLKADWSATLGADYKVVVFPPSGPGSSGSCVVHYRPPILFGHMFNTETQWSQQWFISRSEKW
ncbi:MAG: hypothetical protein U9Q82_04545, partial [Chloroflexota bacterium]|nr:hypothetical protein [Chloroflexota bacterium]